MGLLPAGYEIITLTTCRICDDLGNELWTKDGPTGSEGVPDCWRKWLCITYHIIVKAPFTLELRAWTCNFRESDTWIWQAFLQSPKNIPLDAYEALNWGRGIGRAWPPFKFSALDSLRECDVSLLNVIYTKEGMLISYGDFMTSQGKFENESSSSQHFSLSDLHEIAQKFKREHVKNDQEHVVGPYYMESIKPPSKRCKFSQIFKLSSWTLICGVELSEQVRVRGSWPTRFLHSASPHIATIRAKTCIWLHLLHASQLQCFW